MTRVEFNLSKGLQKPKKISVDEQKKMEKEAVQNANESRAMELRQLLKDSDYKVLPDYDGDKAIIKERKAWRKELRAIT